MSVIEKAARLAARCAAREAVGLLVREFFDFAQALGFPFGASGAWTMANGERLNRFFFNSWPEPWLNIYHANGLANHDPITNEASRLMTVFRHSERRSEWIKDEGQRKVIEIAEEFGWREVFGVPVHGPYGYRGVVALAAFEVPELSDLDCVAIETAARAIHMRCRYEEGYGEGLAPRAILTARQTECLRWVAAGKSDSDIAIILGLSQATVHFHIENAKRVLGLRSRTEAVARLVLDGTL
jgi:LuxR family quorum sensing-dependent transcriptional regulator